MKRLCYVCLILLPMPASSYSQQDKVRVQFVQELHNYYFVYVISMKNGIAVYESNDPKGHILKYLKKGEQHVQ
jgi:hypothetical protein